MRLRQKDHGGEGRHETWAEGLGVGGGLFALTGMVSGHSLWAQSLQYLAQHWTVGAQQMLEHSNDSVPGK